MTEPMGYRRSNSALSKTRKAVSIRGPDNSNVPFSVTNRIKKGNSQCGLGTDSNCVIVKPQKL